MSINEPAIELEKLVAFFRGEGNELGRHGDYENWTPAETAIHYMMRYIEADAKAACTAKKPMPEPVRGQLAGPGLAMRLEAIEARLEALERDPRPPVDVHRRNRRAEKGWTSVAEVLSEKEEGHRPPFPPGPPGVEPVALDAACETFWGPDWERSIGRGGPAFHSMALALRAYDAKKGRT